MNKQFYHKKVGDNVEKTQYSKYFFDTNLPVANYEKMKSFIADQFGFDKAYVTVFRSKGGHVCYPLFQDGNNNYISFGVKDYTYTCINGELKLLDGRG